MSNVKGDKEADAEHMAQCKCQLTLVMDLAWIGVLAFLAASQRGKAPFSDKCGSKSGYKCQFHCKQETSGTDYYDCMSVRYSNVLTKTLCNRN